LEGEPYEVLAYEFLRMQQRKPVTKTKIRNLINGAVVERNFHQNETFEEAEIEKETVKFIYSHRGEYWFSGILQGSQRFSLTEKILGSKIQFLKPNAEITAMKFQNKVINIQLPIKMEYAVKETPPNIRGDTASGGRKPATLETGLVVQVPFFINAGDVVKVNTENGEYIERIEKAKS